MLPAVRDAQAFMLCLHYLTHNVNLQPECVNDAEEHTNTRLYHALLYARYIGLVCSHSLGKV